MNKIFLPAVVFALTLSACGTTPDTQATVEDRTGADATTATTARSGAESTGVDGAGIAGSALPGDPRNDPNSPLSTRSIMFDFDSYEVKAEYRPVLEAHAGYLHSKSDARVVLQGFADERGSREYNLALGQKRAEAVRKALAVLGVGDAQVEAVSFGEEKPRAEGSTEEAYAQNRRTDLVYSDE